MSYDLEIMPRKPGTEINSKFIGFSEFTDFVTKLAFLRTPSKVLLDLSKIEFAHPSGMAPIVAHVRHLHSNGWQVDMALPKNDFLADYFRKAGWIAGLEGSTSAQRSSHNDDTFLPLVSYDSHEQLNPIINEALRHFSRAFPFRKGVLDGLEWAINEVADNVLIHSGGATGWFQLSQQPNKGLIEFVVADCGRGILNSLREGHLELKSDTDALRKAVERGVTRDTNVGQGNGLAGTLRIAMAAGGYVNIYSGAGLLRYIQWKSGPGLNHSGMPHRSMAANLYVDYATYLQGTVVTITLPTMKEIDVAHALWGRSATSMFENQYLSDSGESIIFKVADEANGFGNRPSARPLRIAVENLLEQFPEKRLSIDFSDVSIVSASFADEFVARLAKSIGIATFFQKVSLAGTNDFVRRTLDAVIEQRLNS